MKPILVITGPTASGKSKLALSLAKELNTEIISADSMQIYQFMDIGTAKPDAEERRIVKHHLIDFVNPNEEFSSFLFKQKTLEAIKSFEEKNMIPLIAGGTGFYLKNLLYKFDFEETAQDSAVRDRLKEKYATDGKDALYNELISVDSESAAKLHPNDVKRVMRALEIFYSAGVKKSQGRNCAEPEYEHMIFVLNPERKILYERINRRVDQMMQQGLLKEVGNLINRGIQPSAKSMQAIGYKELIGYINGEHSLNEAVSLIKQHTRNYAKRQITYFKQLQNAIWLNADNDFEILKNTIMTTYFNKYTQ